MELPFFGIREGTLSELFVRLEIVNFAARKTHPNVFVAVDIPNFGVAAWTSVPLHRVRSEIDV